MRKLASNRLKTLKKGNVCQICKEEKPISELTVGSLVRAPVVELIRREHPEWREAGYVCIQDLHRYRMEHVQDVVAAELGELSDLEKRVLSSLDRHTILATELIGEYEGKVTFGDWLADRMATFGGSWTFIGIFFAILMAWVFLNTLVLLSRPFDPYPFIFLNLVLSCLAAIQAPVIMMSQNRQEQKDRIRAEHDYQVNLKAELEIRQLHDKMDHVLVQQWERMVEIQQIQAELIDELVERHDKMRPASEG